MKVKVFELNGAYEARNLKGEILHTETKASLADFKESLELIVDAKPTVTLFTVERYASRTPASLNAALKKATGLEAEVIEAALASKPAAKKSASASPPLESTSDLTPEERLVQAKKATGKYCTIDNKGDILNGEIVGASLDKRSGSVFYRVDVPNVKIFRKKDVNILRGKAAKEVEAMLEEQRASAPTKKAATKKAATEAPKKRGRKKAEKPAPIPAATPVVRSNDAIDDRLLEIFAAMSGITLDAEKLYMFRLAEDLATKI